MSKICDLVYDRLKQLKAERGVLKKDHFDDLGLEIDTIHRCLRGFEGQGLVRELNSTYSARDGKSRMIAFWCYLTDEGREEFDG